MADARFALFRCNAGPMIGGGHLIRTAAIAEALAAEGWRTAFAVNDEALEFAPWFAAGHEVAAGFATDTVGGERLGDLFGQKPDLLVIDSYDIGRPAEARVAGLAPRLVIDDEARRPHDCEYLVDYTLGRQAEDYRGLVPEHAEVLAGPDYAVLRSSFGRLRRTAPPRPAAADGPDRVLVSFGLADPDNATGLVIEGLVRAGRHRRLDVVLGSACRHRQAIAEKLSATADGHVHVDIDAHAMAELLGAADLVIGAPGTSTYERLCLACPTLLVTIADNQLANYEAVVAAGAAVGLGSLATLTAGRIASAIEGMDWTALAGTGARGGQIVDGLGTRRIVTALRPDRLGDGRRLWLRPAGAGDARQLHDWQSEPQARQFARNPDIPPYDAHCAWLDRKLEDRRVLLLIVVVEGEDAGMIRLEPHPPMAAGNEAFEISILIGRSHQNMGVAVTALGHCRRLLPEAELHAGVLEANVASQRLFTRAGYRPTAPKPGELRFLSPPAGDAVDEGATRRKSPEASIDTPPLSR